MAHNQRLTLFSPSRTHKNVEQTALYLYETQKPFDKDLEFIVAQLDPRKSLCLLVKLFQIDD